MSRTVDSPRPVAVAPTAVLQDSKKHSRRDRHSRNNVGTKTATQANNKNRHVAEVTARINKSTQSQPIKDRVNKGKADTIRKPLLFRRKYQYTLVLRSLNNTFETKYLVIPFQPDGLKLGRPVANTPNVATSGNAHGNIGASKTSKINTSSQVLPDNGNFDSRVLSRNHALLSCDYCSGKIFIKDLKSSNGTFLNGKRINQADVELKVGDTVDLGTDIDSKLEHRKISAVVEDIYFHPLILDRQPISDSFRSKVIIDDNNLQQCAFESFVDHSHGLLDLEDTILRTDIDILNGIFINNSIGTSHKLIDTIRVMAAGISFKSRDIMKLKSIENFILNYTNDIDYKNKLLVEKNDKYLISLQADVKKELSSVLMQFMKEDEARTLELQEEHSHIQKQKTEERETYETEIKAVKEVLEDCKTRLEVEKYKNGKTQQKLNIDPDDGLENIASDCNLGEEANTKKFTNTFLKSWTFWTIGLVSVGVLTVAYRFSSQ